VGPAAWGASWAMDYSFLLNGFAVLFDILRAA